MLNDVPIPIPNSSDKELPSDSDHEQVQSPTAEAEADSPCIPKEESPGGTPDDGISLQTRGVTNDKEDLLDKLPKVKTREKQKKQIKPKAIKT